MTERSAHATIKGYFYQFDHTIVRLLEGTTPQASVVVEGIEDIDISDGNESAFVQCKYYEGSEYNHSLIKGAVIQMLKHFHKAGCPRDSRFRYRVYGHYKKGQEKLMAIFDLDFLKKNFLSYTHENKTHEAHIELGVTDAQLAFFHSLLNFDINAPSYDDQQMKVKRLLVSQILDCKDEDALAFYYPNAINVIQNLAIQSDATKREITKETFISAVNRKEIVFSFWLRQKFGEEYYALLIKKKHFKFPSTKVPKASRIFVIDMTDEFDISKAVTLLAKISNQFSHKEHKRTPSQDRFCPYILLCGIDQSELVLLKGHLLVQGVKFADGYPFHGSAFSPAHLVTAPSQENLIRLKFIPEAEQLGPVVSAISGSIVELFDFFKNTPLQETYVPQGIHHHAIKIDCTYFINEVI